MMIIIHGIARRMGGVIDVGVDHVVAMYVFSLSCFRDLHRLNL